MDRMNCRSIALAVGLCTAGLCIALLSGASYGQYPNRPIKLLIPFPPGGPTDIAGRLIAPKLTEALGQPFVIENKPGASGTLCAETVAKSSPDGYTLLLGTTGTLVSAPALLPRLAYDPVRSFAPISQITNGVFLVVVNASLGVGSLPELVAMAKAKPAQLAFGSGGNGHPLHIAGEMFKVAAGVDLLHVPYKGVSPALTDLLAGRTQVMFEQSAALLPHIRSGKLKALAVAGPSRLIQLPDVPTSAEAGLPGYEVSAWFGLFAPAGTPPDVVARLNRETRRALGNSEMREAFARQAMDPVSSSPEELAALIVSDGAKWARAVKLSGARLD
jgi:tripartite-type tricarboxylate transporter receptor subunit TctC